MKNLFMTLVILTILCFTPSKTYTQNINNHKLTIGVVDATSNSVYLNRLSLDVVYRTEVLANNNLLSAFNYSSLLANYGYIDIIPKEQHLKNRTIPAQETLAFPKQYFGRIGAVLLHPLTHAIFAFNRQYPAVTCTPPDCATQWNGNN